MMDKKRAIWMGRKIGESEQTTGNSPITHVVGESRSQKGKYL